MIKENTTETFWKINRYLSIIIFLLYFSFLLPYFNVDLGILKVVPFYAFAFSPFLELFQIPICILIKILTWKHTLSVWKDFIMMILFFIIKVSVYVYFIAHAGHTW